MWIWCSRCEKCYTVDEFRIVNGRKRCFYPNCDGTLLTAYDWARVRTLNPEYPLIPERKVRYPLAGVLARK